MIPSVQPDVLRTELNRSIYYLVSRERGAPGASRSFDDFRDLRIALAGQLPHLAFPPAGDVADEYAAVARLKLLRSWLETVSAHREGLDVAARHELDQFLMPGPFRMLLPPLGSKAQPMRRSQSWVSIISNSDDDEAAAKPAAEGWAASLGEIFFGEARFDSPPSHLRPPGRPRASWTCCFGGGGEAPPERPAAPADFRPPFARNGAAPVGLPIDDSEGVRYADL